MAFKISSILKLLAKIFGFAGDTAEAAGYSKTSDKPFSQDSKAPRPGPPRIQ